MIKALIEEQGIKITLATATTAIVNIFEEKKMKSDDIVFLFTRFFFVIMRKGVSFVFKSRWPCLLPLIVFCPNGNAKLSSRYDLGGMKPLVGIQNNYVSLGDCYLK